MRLNRARDIRGENGFTMFSVIVMMSVVAILCVGALEAAVGDIPIARGDQDRKSADDAARAGLDWYRFQMNRDPSYWTKCTAVPDVAPNTPAPVNQAWNGTGPDPRRWRNLPGSSAQYTVELVPATGQTQCSTASPNTTMLESNTLRIRATGKVNGKKRSLVGTFKRRSFLDYLYFSDYETLDPVTYARYGSGAQSWAQTACRRYYRDGRRYQYYYTGAGYIGCGEIQFTTGDDTLGPLHTNDELLTCGSPRFGRSGDRTEMSGPSPGWRSAGCGGAPNFVGPVTAPAGLLDLPPSNATLATFAAANYRFTGKTTIVFNGASMTVTNASIGTRTLPLPPPNGVIYVDSGACGVAYAYVQDYNNPTGCADLYVSGTYSVPLTLGSDSDIIVNGNLTHTGAGLMGLVANNFVRVYHPVQSRANGGLTCSNATGTMQDVTIDAAILSLQHSFLVDNYYCGAGLGRLTVNGAIAQRFRGPVGTSGSSSSGYLKSYNYDDRLRYSEPPNFIDPVQASWRTVRITEQAPAR